MNSGKLRGLVTVVSLMLIVGLVGCTSQVSTLSAEMDNPDAAVRLKAVEALGKVDQSDADQAVLVLVPALGDEAPEVRGEALDALIALGQASVEPLIEALGSDSPMVRRLAVVALGAIGDKNCIKSLTKLLEDEDPDVRTEAVKAINRLGDDAGADAGADAGDA